MWAILLIEPCRLIVGPFPSPTDAAEHLAANDWTPRRGIKWDGQKNVPGDPDPYRWKKQKYTGHTIQGEAHIVRIADPEDSDSFVKDLPSSSPEH